FDVFRPAFMITSGINRQSHDLHVSAVEVRFYFCHVTQLGCADRGEVLRMRKQDNPGVPDPIIKPNATLSSVRFKVWRCVTDLHLFSSSVFRERLFQISKPKSMLMWRCRHFSLCDQLAELIEIDVAT